MSKKSKRAKSGVQAEPPWDKSLIESLGATSRDHAPITQSPPPSNAHKQIPKAISKREISRRYVIFTVGIVLWFSAWVITQRYWTWDFLLPVHKTAARQVFPGLLVSLFAAVFLFFDLSGLQKRLRAKLHAGIERTQIGVGVFVSGAAVLLLASVLHLWFVPREWSAFIQREFLLGEEDHYAKASASIDSLDRRCPEVVPVLRAGIWIFKDRQRMNHQDQRREVDATGLAEQQRILENQRPTQIQIEAFRRFALAEAASISAEYKLIEAKTAYAKARAEYQSFLLLPRRAGIQHWRDSANLNLGNIYYYEGDWQQAYEAWSQLPATSRREGNRVAALVMLDRLGEAISVAANGLALLERESGGKTGQGGSRATLVANYMVALMATNGHTTASDLFEREYPQQARLADGDLEATYFLALLCAGRTNDFHERLSGKHQVRTSTFELLRGLHELLIGERVKAIGHFKTAMAVDESAEEVLKRTKQDLEERGWLKIPMIAQQFP